MTSAALNKTVSAGGELFCLGLTAALSFGVALPQTSTWSRLLRPFNLGNLRRPPGPGDSFLAEAWRDVEADSWIDWPTLSMQALITTTLKYTPSCCRFLSPCFISLSVSILWFFFFSPHKCDRRAEWWIKICVVVRLHWKVEQGEDEAACYGLVSDEFGFVLWCERIRSIF